MDNKLTHKEFMEIVGKVFIQIHESDACEQYKQNPFQFYGAWVDLSISLGIIPETDKVSVASYTVGD